MATCNAFVTAKAAFDQELALDPCFLNPSMDKCFCVRCSSNATKMRAGRIYILPNGWCRIGVNFGAQGFVGAQKLAELNGWYNCYHGTCRRTVKSILNGRMMLLKPGDTSYGGTVIKSRCGHIPGRNNIYTSPSIAYASSSVYATKRICKHPSKPGNVTPVNVTHACYKNVNAFLIQMSRFRFNLFFSVCSGLLRSRLKLKHWAHRDQTRKSIHTLATTSWNGSLLKA